MPAPTNHTPPLPLAKIIACVNSLTRWRILVELAKGEPLPANEIATRLGISANGASQNLVYMRNAGVLERTYGKLYRIPKQFFITGENALDLGAFVVRLDYPDSPPT